MIKLPKYFIFFFLLITFAHGQTRSISGRVLDEHLEPMINTKIKVSQHKNYIKTDYKGFYSLELSKDLKQIKLSIIGMENEIVSLDKKCVYDIIFFDDRFVEFETEENHQQDIDSRRKQLPILIEQAAVRKLLSPRINCN